MIRAVLNIAFCCIAWQIATEAGAAAPAGYGSLSGRSVISEPLPPLPVLVPRGADVKDSAICGSSSFPEERLIVNPQTFGVRNVFVYLYRVGKESIHPDLAEPPLTPATLHISGCRYVPHGLCVQVGQTLELTSEDPIPHNPQHYALRNQALGSLVTKGSPYPIGILQREHLPFEIKCGYHPWMSARILVLDHPYMTITDPDGRFEISKIPHGEHSLRIWHELHGYLVRKDISITADRLDLGTIEFTLSNDSKAKLGLQ